MGKGEEMVMGVQARDNCIFLFPRDIGHLFSLFPFSLFEVGFFLSFFLRTGVPSFLFISLEAGGKTKRTKAYF